MENPNAALAALNSLRDCREDTAGRILMARLNQEQITALIAGLEQNIAAESSHGPARRALVTAAALLVKAVAGLEAYVTIQHLLLPEKTHAGEELEAAAALLPGELEIVEEAAT